MFTYFFTGARTITRLSQCQQSNPDENVLMDHTDGWVQDCSISSALALNHRYNCIMNCLRNHKIEKHNKSVRIFHGIHWTWKHITSDQWNNMTSNTGKHTYINTPNMCDWFESEILVNMENPIPRLSHSCEVYAVKCHQPLGDLKVISKFNPRTHVTG